MSPIATHRFIGCCSAVLAALSSPCATAAASCNRSPLSISASIEFITPDRATVTVRHAGVADRQASVGDCLIPGDVVVVPDSVKLAKVFTNDQLIRLQPGQPPYRVTGGLVHIADQAATYLASVVHALSREPAPDLPSATASRSLGNVPFGAIRPIEGLNVKDTQRIPPEVETIVVAWQPAAGAARCELRAAHGASASASPAPSQSWCTLSARGAADGAVVSADTDTPPAAIHWSIAPAGDAEVPRPPWFAAALPDDISRADRAVWGLWLYREAGAEWRMAGLSMLYANRASSWAAARAARTILSGDNIDSPPLAQH